MSEVRQEVEQFIANAYADNYIAPNRIIPKNERPKWRFVVKRLYKELLILAKAPEDLLESSRMLAELYKLMCKACGIYLFNTVDPFTSVIDFKQHYMAKEQEIKLYVLLGLLLGYAEKELWLREYEDSLRRALHYRL